MLNVINGGQNSSTNIFFPSEFLQMIENIFKRIKERVPWAERNVGDV